MSENDVLRYLYLVARRSTILTSGIGINWKQEYEEELKNIDRELSDLRIMVDAEHKKRVQAAE